MAKKVLTKLKLQLPAGQASAAPPVGSALGQDGVNIMQFVQAYNEATRNNIGTVIPYELTMYDHRSFDFITNTPTAAILIKATAGIEKGSAEPHKDKVATITKAQVKQIAQQKMKDLT